MKKIVFVLGTMLISLSCSELRKFCAGSFCHTRNYDFNFSSTELVDRVKYIKRKNKNYDVLLRNDSSNVFKTLDKYDTTHINVYHFAIYDSIRNCVTYCIINLGKEGLGFNNGTIHVGAYVFPEKTDSLSCVLRTGDNKHFFKDYNMKLFENWEETQEQNVVIESIEDFFIKIGAFEVVW